MEFNYLPNTGQYRNTMKYFLIGVKIPKFGAAVTESTKKASRIRTIEPGLYGQVRYLFATWAN